VSAPHTGSGYAHKFRGWHYEYNVKGCAIWIGIINRQIASIIVVTVAKIFIKSDGAFLYGFYKWLFGAYDDVKP